MSIPPRALLFRRTSQPKHNDRIRRRNLSGSPLPPQPGAAAIALRIHAASRYVSGHDAAARQREQAREFAQKNGAWIVARLRRLPDAMPFAHGTHLPLRGVSHRIDHRKGTRGTVWIEIGADMRLLCVAGETPYLPRRVRDFLKREAKRDLEVASRAAAQALGVIIKRVSVRDQSSRWGSCSSTGVLSYSWRLILAPTFVLNYLASHEVAHVIEMNHSRRFWRLVEKICPDMGRAKAWLDAHGADLHRYGLDENT